ncbi:MAG: T9SS type A sorting domain-containing protein [Flavobacteriales bacterium]|nr:T9SS type A sorting domain-containing protein [Flavobacteriales bacterium]
MRFLIFTILSFNSCFLFSQNLIGSSTLNWNTLTHQYHDYGDVLQVNDPLYNNFHCNITLNRLHINSRGATFHTDGSENVSNYPGWVQIRAEVRESPLSTVVYGNTQIYEFIFEIDSMPHLTGPVTIFQRFHDVNDAPDFHMALKGDGQWPSDTALQNQSVLIKAFGQWIKTYTLLEKRNHLKVAIYSHQNGYYKVSLNGKELASGAANTTPDTVSYSGPQFGVYNHGGTYDKIQLTHIEYGYEEWDSLIDMAIINTESFVNCGPDNWTVDPITVNQTTEILFSVNVKGENFDDGVIGLTHLDSNLNFNDLGAIIQFSPHDSIFKARNDSIYEAYDTLKWFTDTTYEMRFVVDLINKKYDAFAGLTGTQDSQIANNFNFRSDWTGTNFLKNIAHWTKNGGCITIDSISNIPLSLHDSGMDKEHTLNVYPIPAKESIVIDLLDDKVKVEILSLNGSLVKSIGAENSSSMTINISDLDPGLYFIQARTKNGIIRHTLFPKL